MREFLFAEDLAEACVFLMNFYDEKDIVNVGTGIDCTIEELARTIMETVGFKGALVFDTTKPDGTPRKLLDVSKLRNAGWTAQTSLEAGLKKTYDWFLDHQPLTATP
jgi:GDP-L-fucose synthase